MSDDPDFASVVALDQAEVLARIEDKVDLLLTLMTSEPQP